MKTKLLYYLILHMHYVNYRSLYRIERLHRFVFDKVYVPHRKKLSLRERYKLGRYNEYSKAAPNWRDMLKEYKTLLNRAYNQKRLHPIFFATLKKMNIENYNRYK